jgi:hypothetical protein
MRAYPIFGLLLALICGIAAPAARASFLPGATADPNDPFHFTFDEFGNGVVDTGSGPSPLVGSLMADPTFPSRMVMTYILPAPVFAGDVRIWSDASKTTLSDVIRFTNANGDLALGSVGDRMIYYSVSGPGQTAPADSGIPSVLQAAFDLGGVVETGVPGNDGFTWTPFVPGASDNIYMGISDVPEPSSAAVALLGMALGGTLVAYRRNSRA